MKVLFFFIAFSILILSPLIRCNDCTGSLQFDLPLQVYGLKDTLSLGDTIRVKLEIPEKLIEKFSGRTYDFINYDFKLINSIGRIDTFPTGSDSNGLANWITLQGESKLSGGPDLNVFLVLPSYTNNVYNYEVLIIPKQRGLFVSGMNTDAYQANPLKKLKGPCSKEPVQVYVKLVNVGNNNYEFMKLSPAPEIVNVSKNQFEEAAGFCFFVR